MNAWCDCTEYLNRLLCVQIILWSCTPDEGATGHLQPSVSSDLDLLYKVRLILKKIFLIKVLIHVQLSEDKNIRFQCSRSYLL